MPRLLAFCCALCLATGANGQWVQAHWDVMGTRAILEFWQDDAESGTSDNHPVTRAIKSEFERLNNAFSPWVASSELYRVNTTAAITAQPVSDEFLYLMEKSREYYKLTDGAFDVTFASAGHLYDYREGKAPGDTELKQAVSAIGLNRVHVKDRQVLFSDAGTRLDFGGIAKGYAIDRAIAILKQFKVQHAYISLGGDSYVLGDRRGRDWQVGIRHPRNAQAVAMRLPVSNTAVSTSGDYERFFIRDGERIHHIIDPGSGRSSHGLVSVTILARKSIDSDALSTSVFVMGAERGLVMINQMPDVSAVLITEQGEVLYSDDLTSPGS